MTRYTEVDRVGPVVIEKIEAEISDAPVYYRAVCDNGETCEWGIAPFSDLDTVKHFAVEHAGVCGVVYGTSSVWMRDMDGNELTMMEAAQYISNYDARCIGNTWVGGLRISTIHIPCAARDENMIPQFESSIIGGPVGETHKYRTKGEAEKGHAGLVSFFTELRAILNLEAPESAPPEPQ